jgi:hypothetical protein
MAADGHGILWNVLVIADGKMKASADGTCMSMVAEPRAASLYVDGEVVDDARTRSERFAAAISDSPLAGFQLAS